MQSTPVESPLQSRHRSNRTGKKRGCNKSYKTALSINPDFPEAHNNLGTILQDKGDLAEAINAFKTALQLDPNLSDAHNNLALH